MNSATENGKTIIHELVHVMTGDTEHTGGADDVTNATASGETIPASRLSAMQSYQACKRFAKCSYQIDEAHPNTRLKAQRGRSTDARGDQRSPAFLDLGTTELYSLDGDPTIDGLISVNGLFIGSVDAVFVLTLDADDDATTGQKDGPFAGREYSIELWVHGNAGEYKIEEFVVDLTNGTRIALPGAAEITTTVLHADGEGLDIHDYPDAGYSQLVFAVAKDQIGLYLEFAADTPADVPVGIFVQSREGIHDEDALTFRMDQWLRDPLLETFGNGVPEPGGPYEFRIEGLASGDVFDVYLDGEIVYSGSLDGDGSARGEFVFPAGLSNEETHSFYAQDSTGEFAYGMTCPKFHDPSVEPPVTTPPPASEPPVTTPPCRPPAPVCGGDPPVYSDLMVFPTPERFLASDLNGDGDVADTILRYKDLRTGVVVNTGLECSSLPHCIDVWGDTIVYTAPPSWTVQYYDVDTGEVRDTGGYGRYPAIHGRWIAYAGIDGTIQLFDISSERLIETGIQGFLPSIHDGVVAFVSRTTRTIWRYELATGHASDTGAAGSMPAIYGDLIIFSTSERLAQEDLNGDGDLYDDVIQYYDQRTGTVFNTQAVGTWPAIYGDVVVFETDEAAVSADLNEDGRIFASVIRYLHLPSGIVTNTKQLGEVPDIWGGTITFYAMEWLSGLDWSGDGDTDDSVVLTCLVQLDALALTAERPESLVSTYTLGSP